MKRPQLVNGSFYHIFNRGVEKRKIFIHKNDYLRFIEGMYEFNDRNAVDIRLRRIFLHKDRIFVERILLVKIHAFCLMPNHFHLLLEQIYENGISLFMQKLGIGYTMYFNTINQRVGPLFQGKFKAKLVEEETYLTHLLRYIHLNPVELTEPEWKEKNIQDWNKVNKFLNSYKWSSHSDYLALEPKFPKIITTAFLHELLGGQDGYREFLGSWLSKDLETIRDLIFE